MRFDATTCVRSQTEAEQSVLEKVRSRKTTKKYTARKKMAKVETVLEEEFATGRVLGE